MEERPLFVRRAGPRALGRTAGPATLAAAGLEQDKLVWLGAALRAGGRNRTISDIPTLTWAEVDRTTS
jgi:hypothetical protein